MDLGYRGGFARAGRNRSRNKIARTTKGLIGAIYARYSSRYQHSIEDQVRTCQEWAERNGITVPEKFVFVDQGITGRSSRRDGLQNLRTALESGQVDVVIIFSTNRLYRKTYQSLAFVEEEIVDRGKRCVFVSSGVDTAETGRWQQMLQMHAMMDEIVVQTTAAHVQAAHKGLLIQNRVFGTVTYGYTGEELPGQKTRQGKPARRLAIDPPTAEWVRKVFHWFVTDRLSISEIIRRLNAENAPLPSKAAKRWSRGIVRRILMNTRYRGWWEYGRTKATWMNKQSYSRKVEREEPLAEMQIEELRILDDVTWYAAQDRLEKLAGNAGRFAHDGDRKSRPRVLNGLLLCEEHGVPLYVNGSYGQYMTCQACLDAEEPALFSFLPRELALDLICERLAELIQSYDTLVPQILEKCRHYAESAQQPNIGQIDRLHRNIQRLTEQSTFILEAPGETEQDRSENRQQLAHLRSERAALQKQLAEIEAARENPLTVPTEKEVRQMIADLATLLKNASHSGDPAEGAALRDIIVNLTGGRIFLRQAGERKQGKGWLRATFEVRLPDALLSSLGHPGEDSGDAIQVEIDIKRLNTDETLMWRVKELYDQGQPYQEIAQNLGCHPSRVRKLLKTWAEEHGKTLPDGRTRRFKLDRKPNAVPQYQKHAEEAQRLWEEGQAVSEIARRLQCSAPTIEKAIGYWHESRGLPVPSEHSRQEQVFQRAKHLYDEGWELKQIAETLGYSKNGLQRCLKNGFRAMGLELPDGRARRWHRLPEIEQSAS